ncbi:MAG TPA: transposase [Gemmatimonadaceae bacterium]|nr:transposase [Gemmatimonadaceae bacterium]
MALPVLRTLLACVEVFRPALTRPGYENALVVFVGWVRATGRRAITEALLAADVAARRHHERFHRFFSRGAWSPDALGQLLFLRLLTWSSVSSSVHVVLDDTLTPKKGAHVFGIGSHLDAVRSTRRFRVFSFGHIWVVVSVVVRVPFSRRPWAIPVLFRLYRNKAECERKGDPYRKKTQLGRELVEQVAQWAGGRRIHLATDVAYCNDTLIRGLPSTVTVFGAMRPDAVLTALPPRQRRRGPGRRRLRGRVLPKPDALARSERHPWQKCRAQLYGRERTVSFKTVDAQWYHVCGAQLVRVVVVRVDGGTLDIRVFMCTDPSIDVRTILETYADRWALEVAFRDLKQELGFADSSARKRAAVERTAPFVGYVYSTLVVWYAEGAWESADAKPPMRPWYRHKRGRSFADIVRTARRALSDVDILDPAHRDDKLRELTRGKSRTQRPRRAVRDKRHSEAA